MTDARPAPSDAYRRLVELADYCTPLALRVAADLGIADVVGHEPLPVDQIAEQVGADPRSLRRLLRALAAREIFTEEGDDCFGNTPMSSLLRSDHPLSMRDSLTLIPSHLRAWAGFDHSVRTGEPAFDHVHGATEWEYFDAHPDEGVRFDRSMRSLTRLMLRTSLRAYPWGDLGTIADIGGGDGTFVCGLLARYKELRAVLFDRGLVVRPAQEHARARGVDGRLEIVAGDLFGPLPVGYGGYILKLVLHAFDDSQAAGILRGVRMAMRSDSRVVVVESVLQPDGSHDPGRTMDLQMMATTRGRERTETEFADLFRAAGLRLTRVVASRTFSVIEGLAA